jgi:hypothetical protein
MTQVLAPQKEAELEQTPSEPGSSFKRRIAHVALAAALVIGAMVGLVAFSADGPDRAQSRQAEAAGWEASGHHYYYNELLAELARIQQIQPTRAQWLAEVARIQQIQPTRAPGRVDHRQP